MRKIKRINEPDDLANNKDSWTNEFINEVKKKHGYKGMNQTIKNRYNTLGVKNALKKMYGGKCCYCENRIGIEGFENIEHLKPKSLPQFHMLAFSWENLHWCCEKCNTLKKAKWNSHYPILDPTKDNPENHIYMNTITGKIEYKTRRGKTTINHTKLNRDELVTARKRIIDMLNKIFLLVQGTPTLKDDENLLDLLKAFIEDDAEFASLIKQYISQKF